ncbi:cytochrome c oxidase cbb3-type subunit 3/ubiquinol-cytochrome c reductase cytochrome c subunit [Edaphobacter modestus]|uniref:Cytochrome c oxidase cbb3-type subunit 3/ubiquinol-cytochrome c reductase cytochrome c subunit n=2 Tax=Edaphobacter modestus TaxID=388466 RepID=A0A4Q7YUR6_9BACT|nr:cytochrome c oxidase cbb3-type subunit 3/ubiquinol-cytochrome c reductase cytochrome c subunit [Edaphobacter modestus]
MRPASQRLTMFGALLLSTGCMVFTGCSRIPGRPGPGPEVVRPEQVLAFPTLYKENCAACHGESGRNGAAISLANPVYIAVAGEDNLRRTITKGITGSLMPPFAKSAGGMLTDQQINVLAQGIVQQWGTPNLLAGQNPPPYQATLTHDAEHGQQAFTSSCARCHGPAGEGTATDQNNAAGKSGARRLGSIVDPSYLALISDQGLRSIIIAGRPHEGMPDWRTDAAQPLTDQQITDIVAWLASKRVSNPGQPYLTHY